VKSRRVLHYCWRSRKGKVRGERMNNFLANKEEEYVVDRLVALMTFEPQRWKFIVNTADDYWLRYRRYFGRPMILSVTQCGIDIEMISPSHIVFRGESTVRLREAIERLRRVTESQTPALLSALRVLGVPKTAA
jgi:hypothetical protein